MKKLNFKTGLLFFMLAVIAAGALSAQTTVAVVSRMVSGQENWTDGMRLEVNGENAMIFIESHASNTVEWQVQLSARHADRNIAQRNLKNLKWISDVKNKRLIMRNYIELERGDRQPEAFLEAVYHIKVPVNCDIVINEYFGEISVNETSGKLNIQSEFAPVSLSKVSGAIDVESNFGDVTANELSGEISFLLTRADLNLTAVSGKMTVKAEISEINMEDSPNIETAVIRAEKSGITIPATKSFRYLVDLDEADFSHTEWMSVPDPDKSNIIEINNGLAVDSPLIEIHLNIGTLNLK